MAEVVVEKVLDSRTRRLAFERLEVPREGANVLLTKPGGLVVPLGGRVRARRLVSQDGYVAKDGSSVFLNGYVDIYVEAGEGPVGGS